MDTQKPIRVSNPIDALKESVAAALEKDLLPPSPPRNGRPDLKECRVSLFEQPWLTTALGFQRMPPLKREAIADTVVVIGPRGDACVYFAGELAYHIRRPSQFFWTDLTWQRLVAVDSADEYDLIKT